jgi:hypothetical protein
LFELQWLGKRNEAMPSRFGAVAWHRRASALVVAVTKTYTNGIVFCMEPVIF